MDIEALEHRLESLLSEALKMLESAPTAQALEELRVKFLGRKGSLAAEFEHLRDPAMSAGHKASFGQKLNGTKRRLEEAFEEKGRQLKSSPSRASDGVDPTLPGYVPEAGRLHPVTRTIQEILSVFSALGFSVVDGPEMETDYNNFTALNFPQDHPSRDGFDTFYLPSAMRDKDGSSLLLRTHTSPVQIRFMKTHKPPFMIVVPGRVYRRDAVDATHSFQFHQVEGLAVGPGINFGDLKGTLSVWARQMFGEETRVRFRPHFFPFTEPSAEMDVSCIFCGGKGCRVCSQTGWLEILGCGMVHPNVFKTVGYLPATTGFAFGVGVERIAMLKHRIEDIRYFFDNDLRFLRQFP